MLPGFAHVPPWNFLSDFLAARGRLLPLASLFSLAELFGTGQGCQRHGPEIRALQSVRWHNGRACGLACQRPGIIVCTRPKSRTAKRNQLRENDHGADRSAGRRQDRVARKPESIGNVSAPKPMNGAEFLELAPGTAARSTSTASASRTSRRIRLFATPRAWSRGFMTRCTIRSTADKLMVPTDTGNGGMTHAYFKAPKNVDESDAGRDAIAEWARHHLRLDGPRAGLQGGVSRHPRRQCGFLRSVSGQRPALVQVQPGARAVRQPRDHPSAVDRDRPPNEVSDVCCHVEKETDAGIIVSGAKVVATGSALTNYTFVAHHGLIPVQDKNFAAVFMIPTNAPGVKLICRTSYEMTSTAMGSPFDYPLSSRLDENDAVFIMDKVLVPWENVFVYGDVEKANNFFPRTGFLPRARAAWLHAARGEARLHRGPVAEGGRSDRHQGFPRRAGECRRGDRLAQPVLGLVRRDGARSEARGSAIICCRTWIRATPTRSSPRWPTPRSNTSSSRRSRPA